ncbi:MAG: LysR family transcriptional regulator [Verrucomicrobia bacterium]|nr:LysR family transcriptional regulator [Verrucomicrobiota bacterium]
MELRHLQSFVAIVEEGSLSAAALRQHLSQPALSQQLQALEQELGESLLHRRPRGVDPTTAGELLLTHARTLLAQAERLRGDFRNRRELETGRVAFGIIPTLAPYLLPQLLGPFRKAHPGVTVSINESRTDQLIQKVASGEIEFAILSGAPASERKRASLQLSELFREPLLLATPDSHPLALRKTPPAAADLDPAEVIHLSGGHCLAERTLKIWHGCKPDFQLQCDQIATALAMVSAGMGVTIVPKLAAHGIPHPNITCRAFAGAGIHRPIHLMKRRNTKLSPPADRLLAAWLKPA